MSDQLGDFEPLLWDQNQFWFSNSDDFGVSNGNFGWNPPDLGSNTQTPRGKEVEAVAVAPPEKKRSRVGKASASNEVNEEKSGGESDHIWTERERRKRMKNMFANLQALLPQLPPKADKSAIVDEAVSYIKSLQQNLQKLQRQKLERFNGATTINSCDPSTITQQKLAMDSRKAVIFLADRPQVSSNYSGINYTTPSSDSNAVVVPVPQFPPPAVLFRTWTSPNVVLNVCGDKAQISVCSSRKPGLLTSICCVLEKYKLDLLSAHVSSDHNKTLYMIQTHARMASHQFPEAFPVEEKYKQAAGEIMFWVNS